MVDWDWDANPTYESERVKIDATCSPAVLYDMKRPRQVEDHEVALMLDLAECHLERDRPFLALVRQRSGTGVIGARHRKVFSDWLDDRRAALARDDSALIVVVPEAIFRALLRVVYRFRSPPLRTLTTADVSGALDAMRGELTRIGRPILPRTEAFFANIT